MGQLVIYIDFLLIMKLGSEVDYGERLKGK